MAAQDYQDALQALDRLEKRVFYLQQARQIGIQQLPQIRIVQSGDETLIENLQATTELTIPVWKQKMILLLGLTRQRSALDLQKTVTDATNEMMKQASEMMKNQAIEIEKQASAASSTWRRWRRPIATWSTRSPASSTSRRKAARSAPRSRSGWSK